MVVTDTVHWRVHPITLVKDSRTSKNLTPTPPKKNKAQWVLRRARPQAMTWFNKEHPYGYDHPL